MQAMTIEPDSKAKVTAVSTQNIEALDFKGCTGNLSADKNVKPSTCTNLSFDFNGDAYTGKRKVLAQVSVFLYFFKGY